MGCSAKLTCSVTILLVMFLFISSGMLQVHGRIFQRGGHGDQGLEEVENGRQIWSRMGESVSVSALPKKGPTPPSGPSPIINSMKKKRS